MCYGQTGAGKTFTMTGVSSSYKDRGILPRVITKLYDEIRQRSEHAISVRYDLHLLHLSMQCYHYFITDAEAVYFNSKIATNCNLFRVKYVITNVLKGFLWYIHFFYRISYMEIYNETMLDLLTTLPAHMNGSNEPTPLTVVEDENGVYVKGLSNFRAESEEEALNMLFEVSIRRFSNTFSLKQHLYQMFKLPFPWSVHNYHWSCL